MTTTVTEERRTRLRDAADAHDQWAPQHLDAPFDPPKDVPEDSVYNQHYVDLNADGEAQDEYADQVAAAMGGTQTAAIVDKLGHHHSEKDGKFVSKGSAAARALKSGQPDSLAGFSREQLQREVRRRNRDGAGIKLRRGATVDEIKEALHSDERGKSGPDQEVPREFRETVVSQLSPFGAPDSAIESRIDSALKERGIDSESIAKNRSGARNRGAAIDAVALHDWRASQGQAPMDTAQVREAKLKLERAETMHGSDRSKWTQRDRAAAEKLDRVIAGSGSMAERRAQRDAADQQREAAKAKQRQALAGLAGLDAAQREAKLNDLSRRIADPDTSAAEAVDLQEQRRELRRLMGVKVASTRPVRARQADVKETTKYSNPQPRRASDLKAESDARGGQPGEAQRLADLASAVRGDRRSASAGTAAERIRDLRRQIMSAGPDDRDAEDNARDRAAQMLDGLTKPQLAKVADDLGVVLIPGQRKEQQLRSIVEAAVGRLLDSRAIARVDLGSPFGGGRRNQAFAIEDDSDVFEEAFSAALDAANELAEDATEEEFAAEFMAEFASRMPERLARWWTEGPGVARVKWFIRGAFRRCKRALKGEGVPGRMLDGACANLYHRATGRWPGAHKGAQTAALRHEAIANLAIGLEIPAEVLTAGGIDEFAPLESFELEELVNILTEEMNMDPVAGTEPTYGASESYHTGQECPPGQHAMPDGSCMDDTEMAAGEVWWWEGRLAPIATPTSDQVARQFAPGALSSRGLPRALRWQEKQDRGHDGAVTVGSLTEYRMQGGMPWGKAYFFDDQIIPDAGKARYLVEHGVIAPSVDLEPSMDVAYADADGNVFSPEVCMKDGSCPSNPRQLITRGTIAAATLVPIAAFSQLGAGRLYRGPAPQLGAVSAGNQVAAVQTSGWDDLPIAGRDRDWDKGAADQRVTAWATTDGEISWPRYGQAFLWHGDDPTSKGAFKFPVADVIDGELTIIPRGVFAAAARLNQADVSADAKDGLRDVISDLYDQMAEELDDDDIVAPWDDDREEMSVQGCGCAAKMGAMTPGTQTADAGCGSCGSKYGVFGNIEPYPEDAFGPRKFDKLTPLQIEQRPGEPFARLFGHIGDWNGCNRGVKHVCLPPPKSRTNYAEFHTAGNVRVPSGLLRIGKVVMGEGHPDTSVSARVARAYYAETSKEVGHVRAYEDQFAPYINGVVAPGVTPEEATKLLASPPSGDWKAGELIAVLAVNVAGHPVRTEATFGADGQPVNMVAAGRFWTEDDDGLLSVAEEAFWAAEHARLMGVANGLRM